MLRKYMFTCKNISRALEIADIKNATGSQKSPRCNTHKIAGELNIGNFHLKNSFMVYIAIIKSMTISKYLI